MKLVRVSLALGLLVSLPGCVAAVVPLLAAGTIGGKQIFRSGDDHRPDPTTLPTAPVAEATKHNRKSAEATASQPPVVAAAPAPVAGQVPAGMQYLYGSGEAAAISVQAYQTLIDMMVARASDRAIGMKVYSVVLAPGSSLAAPQFVPCENKPLAVVLDIDETSLLNLGYEADDSQRAGPYDPARWARWEKTGGSAVVATPGLVETAKAAKQNKVTLVYNSNRLTTNADETATALSGAGLGPVEHLKTLWLQGDEGTTGAKDTRRWAISKQYCVIAMVGDQLGDFSDLFNAPDMTPAARRTAIGAGPIRSIWGHGWFILPNPVYGTALKGKIDDVFPADKRWTDPGPAPATAPAPAPTGGQ